MSRKGYHLLATSAVNSDPDDEEETVLFDSAQKNAGDGWSDGEMNIFADSTKMESIELRPRNGGKLDELSSSGSSTRSKNSGSPSSSNNGVVLLERRVRKDDTLQKISLQFSISIAELKRVNGFLADTDLFARDIIKIPVRKYGYNHALIMAELDGHASTLDSDNSAASSSLIGASAATSVPATVNVPVQAERLLQTVDANVQKAQRQLEQRQQSREIFNADNGFDDEHTLDERFLHGGGRNSSRNGHVWLERNVRHFLALVLIIFVLIGVPVIIYVVYNYHDMNSHSKSEHSQNHH